MLADCSGAYAAALSCEHLQRGLTLEGCSVAEMHSETAKKRRGSIISHCSGRVFLFVPNHVGVRVSTDLQITLREKLIIIAANQQ